VYVSDDNGPGRSLHPDVRVTETDKTSGAGEVLEMAVAEPLIIEVEDEPLRESFIEIREASAGNRLVTVIELLSPTKKRAGPGRRLYRKKQNELKAARVSLVEIDLVRAGRYTLALPRHHVPASAWKTPAACIWRSWQPT